MDIDQSPMPAVDEICSQDAHEASQTYEFNPITGERSVKGIFEGSAGFEIAVLDNFRRDAGARGPREAGGIGTVRDNDYDFGREGGIRSGIDQRLKIGTAARDQNGGP